MWIPTKTASTGKWQYPVTLPSTSSQKKEHFEKKWIAAATSYRSHAFNTTGTQSIQSRVAGSPPPRSQEPNLWSILKNPHKLGSQGLGKVRDHSAVFVLRNRERVCSFSDHEQFQQLKHFGKYNMMVNAFRCTSDVLD